MSDFPPPPISCIPPNRLAGGDLTHCHLERFEGICVKWVPFVKLAFSPGNRAHFGLKTGLFSAFSHYVFNDCGPNRGFHSDFALSPILTL